MNRPRNIVVLTGAGISAESGIETFRAADGLWAQHRIEDVCTPGGFRRNPGLVQGFYDMRRAALAGVVPNAAHEALALLDAEWPGEFLLVTQNVDDLHDRAGSKRLLHMHGELKRALCTACGAASPWDAPLSNSPPCPRCGATRLRPDIVWFEEMPYHMDAIDAALSSCDLFVSIGTSGAVYPAAGFVSQARRAGAATLELNLDPSAGTPLFGEARHGPASVLVPAWVDELLG
ncbi:NAD-dependent deacylase [Glacieibacterium frigidum]|uniref:NAD-dependent protein deacylase n=1 Tax=Glacieibacterium frigidum TaxID=2593303 RepID=A0A552U852_9SPHN|nr:NAD-dependent deacylase [Glacieibacterium frigidum]TRW14397.1 NAD-dependent deacylase [Glacieibacterium frigidum]